VWLAERDVGPQSALASTISISRIVHGKTASRCVCGHRIAQTSVIVEKRHLLAGRSMFAIPRPTGASSNSASPYRPSSFFGMACLEQSRVQLWKTVYLQKL